MPNHSPAEGGSEPDTHDLAALLESLRSHYPELISPSAVDLSALVLELAQARRRRLTLEYFVVTTTAVVFVVTAPLIAGRCLRAAVAAQPYISNLLSQRAYLTRHPETALAAFLGAFGILYYTLVMPWEWRPSRFLDPLRLFAGIELRGWPFVLYATAMNYLAGWAVLLYLNSYADGALQRWATTVWLFLPAFAASAAPAFLVVLCLTSVIHERLELYRDAPQAAVLRQLLLLLRSLKGISNPSQLSSAAREDFVWRIIDAARMLGGLCDRGGAQHGPSHQRSQRMRRVGGNFLTLATWVAFPRSDTFVELGRRLVQYTNIMAKGTYDELPVSDVDDSLRVMPAAMGPKQWRRALDFGLLFLLLSSPLAVFAAALSYFHWELPPGAHTVILVAYSAWVALSLLSYMDKLAPESKAVLIDLIRILGRKG